MQGSPTSLTTHVHRIAILSKEVAPVPPRDGPKAFRKRLPSVVPRGGARRRLTEASALQPFGTSGLARGCRTRASSQWITGGENGPAARQPRPHSHRLGAKPATQGTPEDAPQAQMTDWHSGIIRMATAGAFFPGRRLPYDALDSQAEEDHGASRPGDRPFPGARSTTSRPEVTFPRFPARRQATESSQKPGPARVPFRYLSPLRHATYRRQQFFRRCAFGEVTTCAQFHCTRGISSFRTHDEEGLWLSGDDGGRRGSHLNA
jgi:hypothetical protein